MYGYEMSIAWLTRHKFDVNIVKSPVFIKKNGIPGDAKTRKYDSLNELELLNKNVPIYVYDNRDFIMSVELVPSYFKYFMLRFYNE